MRTERTKLLLLSLCRVYGGGEIHYTRLARLLDGEADLTAVVCSPTLGRMLRGTGVTVHEVPSWARHSAVMRIPLTWLLLVRCLLNGHIRCVHLNGQAEAMFALPLRLLGRRVIITRHSALTLEANPIKRWLYRFNARLATEIVCVSSYLAEQHAPFLPPGRLSVVPNWVTEERRMTHRREESSPYRLLFVGRLVPAKGLADLLAAIRGLEGIELWVLGDGPQRQEAERIASGTNTVFWGFQQHPEQFYEQANLFVSPSHSDGFSLVLMEAMSHGLTALVSDLPAHRELSNDGAGAMLFRVGDVLDLRSKIEHLRNNPQDAENLARAGRQIVDEHFTSERVAPLYRAVFQLL
ncbi:glycosyltransferase family 4 protein [uncultured Paludibaculum sp.]|uniref:glycosyltransferase family 4 protein n=1 Tax=uncultured Paludibaculum sp. TaxID=1765020 RepID=UPI002AAAC25E|nr:glycosyltransferase family 4 protein [uncultured Paludibaculum sp.]